VPELEWWEIAVRLLVAAGLTGAIGAERELRERAAGLRTHMLVGVGSALFTLVSAYAWHDFVGTAGSRVDPTRIAAQVVSGIGFLGAGAILRQGLSVRGLTTAAGLWAVAAIGMASAAGFYPAAVIATVIVMIGLGPLRNVERRLNRFGGDSGILEVRLTPARSLAGVLSVVEPLNARIHGIEFDSSDEERWVRIDLELPRGRRGDRMLADLSALEDVEEARWSG
jgi:putative Mg2+ transporter-C (MgtC) family protein